MPILHQLYPLATKQDTEILLISLASTEDTAEYARENNIEIPIVAAPRESNPLHEAYQVPGTPSFYVINVEGKIQQSGVGLEGSGWKELVSSLKSQQSHK